MKIRYKIWLESEGRVIFGQGRVELLRAIEAYHSLNAAAKKLGMSYRAAWGRLRASEDRLGVRLVETHPNEKGMHLTLEGKLLLDRYTRLEEQISTYMDDICDVFSKEQFTEKKGPLQKSDLHDNTKIAIPRKKKQISVMIAPILQLCYQYPFPQFPLDFVSMLT